MAILRQLYQAVLLCVAIHLAYCQQNAMDNDDGYFYYQKSDYPKDCQDVYTQCTESNRKSGVYWIKPEGYEDPFEVYCDQENDGGGWTVFQRRHDGHVTFARNWDLYKEGFGFMQREFWMGNDKLAYLTNQRTYKLRINMTIGGQDESAEYSMFRITDEEGSYRMVHLGDFSGSSGFTDQMSAQLNQDFSTFDRRGSTSTCASSVDAGGWWFVGTACTRANLNGDFSRSSHPGAHWQSGSEVTVSEMKVKPVTT